MADGDITRGSRIEDIPGFRDAVNTMILDMIRSGAMTDAIQDAMNGAAAVGLQAQPAPPPSREQFDMQPTRLSQLVRFRKDTGDVAGDTHFDILIPMSGGTNGVDNAVGQVEMLTQNGTTVMVAAGELTCIGTGPWWKIKGVSGRDGYPTSSINACARYNLGGTSGGNWPVAPGADNFIGIKFYTGNDGTNPIPTAPDTALAGQYGLSWQIASIGQGADGLWTDIRQVAVGEPCKTAIMGDADVHKGATGDPYQSVVTDVAGIVSIKNFGMSPLGSSDTTRAYPMVTRDENGIAKMVSQAAVKMGDGDAVSPTQESIHTRGVTNDFEIDHFGDTAVDPVTGDTFVGATVVGGVKKVKMLNATQITEKGDADATANTDQNTIHKVANSRFGLLLGTTGTCTGSSQTALIIDRSSGVAVLKECATDPM